MTAGVGLWILAMMGTTWTAGMGGNGGTASWPLLLMLSIIGAAEAVVLPTMQRVLANWVPPERRATALAIVISGFQLGTVGA